MIKDNVVYHSFVEQSTKKIDGVIATIMALDRSIVFSNNTS